MRHCSSNTSTIFFLKPSSVIEYGSIDESFEAAFFKPMPFNQEEKSFSSLCSLIRASKK
jgi:hypothetical protein